MINNLTRQQRGDLVWMPWVAGALGTFAVLEAFAVNTNAFPTLSETLSRWLGLNPAKRWGDAAMVLLGAGGTALVIHLIRWDAAVEEVIAEAVAAQIADLEETE